MSDEFDRWRHEGRSFRYQGHSIFYRAEGTGPTLLAIHGFPSASWDWHRIWPDLIERFHVVAPDMLGFGWSDKPRPYRYSIMDQATLHEQLLQELDLNRVHILAHDYGDTVAQELLARSEDRTRRGETGLIIDSVCFLNGGLFPEAHRPRPIQRLLASPLGSLVGRATRKRTLASSLTRIFGPNTPPSPDLIDELWTLLLHQDGHLVTHLLIGYMAERKHHRERWVDVLTRTPIPLRLIDGTADPISGANMVVRYRELVPTADVVELPGIGHYPQIEDPAGVLRAFLGWASLRD